MNTTQLLQILAALAAPQAPAAPEAPVAPAPTPVPAAPSTIAQTFRIVGGVNAFKSTSNGYNKGRWMMSMGDVTVRWAPSVLPKKAFVKGERCLVTTNRWEVTFSVSPSGRVYAIGAADTHEPYVTASSGLDDVGEEPSLDTEAEGEQENL